MKIFTALIFVFLLCGCAMSSHTQRIPNGIYEESSKSESVKADNKEGLIFTIRVPKFDPQKVFSRGPYEYRINSSGNIRIFASSNDSIFVFGIMNFDRKAEGARGMIVDFYNEK